MTAEELRTLKLICSYCPKEFKYESEKRRHELSHSPQFQCNVCSKKYSFISALRRHEKQHNRNGSVACNRCSRKFRDENLLKRHMNYAHKGTYKCKKCLSTFSSEVALKVHMKTHRPVSERRYRCSFTGCNKTFNFSHHLKHHEPTHTEKKLYFCNVCGKGFIQLHHLKTHIKKHEPDKWVYCSVSNCPKRFATEYDLKRHLATHDNKIGDKYLCKSKSIRSSSVKLKTNTKVGGKNKNKKTNKTNANEKETLSNLETLKIHSNINNNIASGTDCKAVLGSCLNGDPEGDNCLCAQMAHREDEPYDLTPIAKKNDISLADTKSDTIDYCDSLECATTCKGNRMDNETMCNSNIDSAYPKIEYGVDGIIKLSDTFDFDITKNIVNQKYIITQKAVLPHNDRVHCENIVKSVPYNSCKAILGKCIVSGSGTISENCLCAKMHFDELQVLAEEVEDIVPHPNDPQLDSFVII